MSKWYSKQEKLVMLKKVEGLGCTTANKILGVNKKIIADWRKLIRVLGEEGLISGKSIQSKNKKKGRPKTLQFHDISKEELIKYLEVINDIKKYLERSTKQKY